MNYKHKLILLLALMAGINTNSMWQSNLFGTKSCAGGDYSACETILAGLTPQQVILLTSSTAALAIVGFNYCRRMVLDNFDRKKQIKSREEAYQRHIIRLQQARDQQVERDWLDVGHEEVANDQVMTASPRAISLIGSLWLADNEAIQSEVLLPSFVPVDESWDCDYSQDDGLSLGSE